MLLRAINMSGKLHMVPALINDQYVIRFAICAQNACEDDILFAWNVIGEMAVEVLEACRSSNENDVTKSSEKLQSLDPTKEDDEEVKDTPPVVGIAEKPEAELNDIIGEDELFLYDDNIPSIPSISTL